MDIISSKKNKQGVTEVQFGDKKAMVDKLKKMSTSNGFMVKRPTVNPNLKIKAMTDSEKALSDERAKYQKNGKTTFMGAAKLMGDIGKKIIKRVTMQEE